MGEGEAVGVGREKEVGGFVVMTFALPRPMYLEY